MSETPRYYPWARNEIKVKDPENSVYVGNVIGNVSKEEQISAIFSAGNECVSEINETGNALNEQVAARAAKYTKLWGIVDSVETGIMAYFGE